MWVNCLIFINGILLYVIWYIKFKWKDNEIKEEIWERGGWGFGD